MNMSNLSQCLLLACTFLGLPRMCEAKLKVVATTPDIASIVQAVGGPEVELTTLVRPTEDPHFIDPKPSLIVKLTRADVLVEGGAELEAGWLPPLLQRAANSRIQAGGAGRIRANDGIAMLEVPTTLDRSKGDIHAAGNPHFLTDPDNALIFARKLASTLARLDPGSAAEYQKNGEAFASALEKKLAEWQKTLEPFKGQSIASYHNSWPYFARRFGFKIDLFLEPKPGIPPSPAHLAQVIEQMKQQKTRAIFVDPYLDRRTAETVAGRTGAKVVPVTQFPGGVKGTEAGYIAMMYYVVRAVGTALGAQESTR